MELPNLMNTLSNVLHKLQKKGMDNDFKWSRKGFTLDGQKYYQPHDLTIIKIYRFEEFTNPDDLCVLYLIETNNQVYGYILDTYGAYSNHNGDFNNALRLIPESKHPDQLFFEL